MTSISDSFQLLLNKIQPVQSEIDAAVGHLDSIQVRLAKAFDVKKFLKAGSFSRGSFITGKSDVDLFVVVSRESVRWGDNFKSSYTVLDDFRGQLEGRFWNTSVYRDVNSIVVEFTDYKVDVVPAVFAEFATEHKWPLYWIPDGSGGWMKTSPDLHNAYIKQENDAASGKLRYVAQLLKFWRECRNPRVPLSSFHIEMVLASHGTCKGVKSYASCVTEVLQNLAERECRAMQDPFGICGYIPAVKSERQREDTLASVKHSRDHAKAAVAEDYPGNLQEARRQWDIVFYNKFPW